MNTEGMDLLREFVRRTDPEWDINQRSEAYLDRTMAETGAWITCVERMPPDLVAVLCACTETDDGLGPAVYAGFRSNGRWISQDKSGIGDPVENDIAFPVSHWMPLPEPPK